MLELIACLGASQSLTHVDLSWNRIGERDGAVFSALLRNNTTLENVAMGFNSLGDIGLQHLATCLGTNKTLKRLDVRYNGGGPRCACVFARALRENSSLTELVLDGNPLGAEGLRAFSRAAGEITSSLKLRDCLYDVKKPLTSVGLFMEEVKIGKGKKANDTCRGWTRSPLDACIGEARGLGHGAAGLTTPRGLRC